MVVFDKTGTLTQGRPVLMPGPSGAEILAAAGIARASRHPLARALAAAAPEAIAAAGVEELPGLGLRWRSPAGEWRLGRRDWAAGVGEDDAAGAELWLARPGAAPVRFGFADRPARRRGRGGREPAPTAAIAVALLSGDRVPTVRAVAAELGIAEWHGGCAPHGKVARLEAWAAEGRRVLMVGDGLNDAPALAAAHVSLSPATAVDVAQTAADAVFQGALLRPVLEVIEVARGAERLVKQNLACRSATICSPCRWRCWARSRRWSRRSPCRAARSSSY